MTIKVKCVKCGWIGKAEVGRIMGNVTVYDYRCPNCKEVTLKRSKGSYNPKDEWAKLK